MITPDGLLLGVLLCDEVDLLAFEPWRREAAVDALEGLLRSLSAELVLTVRARRHRLAAARTGGEAGALTSALDLHWRERLGATPTLHRRVAASIRHRDPAGLERELASLSTSLAAAGILARRLGDTELREHLRDAGLDLARLTLSLIHI